MSEEMNETEDRPGYPLLVHGCYRLCPRLWREGYGDRVCGDTLAAPLAMMPLRLGRSGIEGLERTVRRLWAEWRTSLELADRGGGTAWSLCPTRAVLFPGDYRDDIWVALTLSSVSHGTLSSMLDSDHREGDETILAVQDLAREDAEPDGVCAARLCLMALMAACGNRQLCGDWYDSLDGSGQSHRELSADIWSWNARVDYSDWGEFVRLSRGGLVLVTDTSRLLWTNDGPEGARTRLLAELGSALRLVSALGGERAEVHVSPFRGSPRCLVLEVSSDRHREEGHTSPEGVLTELLERADQDPFVREWVRRTHGTIREEVRHDD